MLRRNSMLADAVGHSILPGIVLGFLAAQSRSLPVMLAGAGLAAIAAIGGIQFLEKRFRFKPDAATGSVYSIFFASGIVLLSIFASNVDLDQDCVLYGELAYVPLQKIVMGSIAIPKAILIGFTLLTLVSGFVYYFFKPLVYTSFNPEFLTVKGYKAVYLEKAFGGLTALTIVLAFESVGSILIVNLFVVPALIALQLSSRASIIIVYACMVSVICTVIGFTLAYYFNVSITGAIATLSFTCLIFTWVIRSIYESR